MSKRSTYEVEIKRLNSIIHNLHEIIGQKDAKIIELRKNIAEMQSERCDLIFQTVAAVERRYKRNK